MDKEILGKCDYPNCNNVAVWQTGTIFDEKFGKARMAQWCESHIDLAPRILRTKEREQK